MLRDVFYYGKKPNIHPRERLAKDFEDARNQSTTEHFWIVNEFCDYTNFDFDFDFDFLPDDIAWHSECNNVWPSVHQKDSGTWLCSTEPSDNFIYRTDVEPLKRFVDDRYWVFVDNVDKDKFDLTWHHDTTAPPYIYKWGCRFYPVEVEHVLEYRVPNATQVKYMEQKVPLLPSIDNWTINYNIDTTKVDLSWRPDPREPAYNYAWGCKYFPATHKPALVYEMQGATQYKYMDDLVDLKPHDNWKILEEVDHNSFDWCWVPDPTSPPYIYVWGNQHYDGTIMPTIEYHVEGATERKFMTEGTPKLKAKPELFKLYEDCIGIDYTWRPNPTSPPYIYAWGNQWNKPEDKISVSYTVEGATEYQYMEERVKRKPCKDNWIIPVDVDTKTFDYSWEPNPNDPPYVYVFGTQWQKTGGPKYIVKGAEETKYIDIQVVKRKPVRNDNWLTPDNIVDFDYSWHPDETEPPYIYQFGTQWQKTGGPTYTVPGATEVKFVNEPKAKCKSSHDNWIIPDNIDKNVFDFSWHPDTTEEPYIYIFGTQWQKTGGPRYAVPGAIATKYVDTIKAIRIPDKRNFITKGIDIEKFDYSWHPDETDSAYIYVFGNQWNSCEIEPTLEYVVEGATDYKYVHNVIAYTAPDKSKFKVLLPIDETKFNYSWRPNPKDPAYIYVFGNQWNHATIQPTVEYHVEGATEYKYITDILAYTKSDKSKFKINHPIVEDKFDFSWIPNPKDPAYIYVFGNQWYNAEKMSTIEYHVEGATERKYMSDVVTELAQHYTNWEIPENIDTETFDFSWLPDPDSPPYIYQFGTLKDDNDGPRYITPGNDGEVVRLQRIERKDIESSYRVHRYYIETTLEDLIQQHSDEIFWAMNKNINYKDFDFSWRPSIEQARYVHVFGSPESVLTQTYFVSAPMYNQGYREYNFVQENLKLDEDYLASLFKPSDVFYIDRGNAESNERFNKLKEQFPNITKTRYLNSWVDTISRCIKRSSTQLFWVLNSELDYTDFNFKYYPNPWQLNMVHVFGTQWSHWGTTFMVNKDTFNEDTKYVKIIEHLGNLHFAKNHRAKATNNLYDIVLIDHGNSHTAKIKELLDSKANGKQVTVIKYDHNYLKTFNDIISTCHPLKEHYIWVCSSVCDYTNFDFSYICDPFAKENLHVFPSDGQKFGDTFLVDVNRMRELLSDMVLLEDYEKINYNQHQRVPRLPAPIFITEQDTHRTVTELDYDFPYAIFKTYDNRDLDISYKKPISLWSDDTKNIEILSTGGAAIVVPHEVRNYVREELYDYPYISRAEKLVKSYPLDIVFLSNGEKCAEENYEHLLRVTKGQPNRVVRVDGVNGRAAAYHASANASNTPWTFTVFAKLKVNNKFDWSWQPDRLQVPKHYIFNALNPVNKLVYGHQAMIAYNKKLVLNNPGLGLDFTLDDTHEVVDMLSGVATFNTDPYSTWRTAFREVIKLKSDFKDISFDRLNTWLTVGEGDYAQDCLRGAKDGADYYDSVGGDPDKLKLSYEWDWLKNYYKNKYSE